jgi:nitroreductase/NAD-dependent dihydropyrimidine dehydrogenase PreA subunit
VSLFVVDPARCTRDGICVASCPLRIIEMNDGGRPTPTADAEERCMSCGHCVAVCPYGAMRHRDLKPEDCAPVRPELVVGRAQVTQWLRSRRSVRAYEDEPVAHETLAGLLDVARHAPTGTNSQQVRWTVFATRAEVRALAAHVADWAREASAGSSPLAGRVAPILAAWDEGRDPITRGAPVVITAHAPAAYPLAVVDCTIALSYLEVAAPSFDLGACWAGFLMLAAGQWPPLAAALGLPAGHALQGAMMLGRPRFRYHRLPARREAVVDWRG